MSQVIEVSERSFEEDVIARSHEVPVVVDFWAAWCGPCRTLGPVLERLADEADGSWALAKVDVDANPGLAARFGIQGIPAVHAFKDGEDAAEFVGALPEPRVREWLSQLGPTPADVAFEEGARAEQTGDLDAALSAYKRSLEMQPDHGPARAAVERLELAQRAGEIDVTAVRSRLEADPTDVQAALDVADTAAAEGRMDEAASVLIESVRVTTGDDRDRVRLHLLRLLDTLSTDHPVSLKARKALSLVLF
jgi:putative thioredoxin